MGPNRFDDQGIRWIGVINGRSRRQKPINPVPYKTPALRFVSQRTWEKVRRNARVGEAKCRGRAFCGIDGADSVRERL